MVRQAALFQSNGQNLPPVIVDQTLEIEENATMSVFVAASDPNAGDTLTYSIIGGNEAGLFTIDPVTGEITRTDDGTFDFETDQTSYTLIVQVTDDAGRPLSSTAAVTLQVTDVNEGPTAPTLSGSFVAENDAGAVIGAVAASDPDDPATASGQITFSVDDGRFEVVDGVLKLKDGFSLDHEADAVVTVTLTATDGGGLSSSQTYAITVGDANEAPAGVALSNASVDENAAGAVIGTLTASDPDDPTQPFGQHTFTVDDERFEVVGDVLKLKDGRYLNHEIDETVTVNVTAVDGSGLVSFVTPITITVSDVNEAPHSMRLWDNRVDEDSSGAVVGRVEVSDPDDWPELYGQHTITVDDARFEVVDGWLKLKDGVSLDYEAEPTVQLNLTAVDNGGLSLIQPYTIHVDDLNDAPTGITATAIWDPTAELGVYENVAGAWAAYLTVLDPDAEDDYTYTVDDDRFIAGPTLRLKDGIALDHEAEETVTVTVTATDKGGLSTSATFTIAVNDANDAPTEIVLSNATVTENADGAVIGALTAIDQDDPSGPYNNHTFDIVGETRFEIVDDVLKLKDGVTLDFEIEPSVTVTIGVLDGAGVGYVETLTIDVLDVVEPTDQFASSSLDLTGGGDNSVTLGITDLLQVSDGGNDLFVAGDAGDQVTLVGDWQAGGQATVDGVVYDTFGVAGVNATLFVEDDVATVSGIV